MKASISIILHTNVVHKSGKYPIKLRVTYQRKSKYYHINNLYVTEKDFIKITGDKPREENIKAIKHDISKRENEADDIIKKLPYFTFDIFEKEFLLGKKKTDTNIFNWFANMIAKLNSQERIKTAMLYSNSQKSLEKYTKKSELSFYDISIDFLHEYENWFVNKQENSPTTLGIYLRNVRALFNEAIEAGIIVKDSYPFGRRKYEIPAGNNTKKALILSEIQKIYNFPAIKFSSRDKWRDLWIFSYLCNGANVKDICLLKYKNISEDRITFIRAKTKRTKKTVQKPIVVFLTEEVKAIIKKWGNKDTSSDNYVFPILTSDLNAVQVAATIDQTTWNINKHVKDIAKKEKINKHVTTYTARHSFATVLKRSGASTEFISESIGHADLKTTENYLDSFEDDMKKEFAKRLLNFGNDTKNNTDNLPN